ncbi:MAG TPA: serine hydrolase domain-containing protein [Bryobacteraceae bacterium]|nr:serine hydrolase domain-containing protein [Bryobacteraceae bacterium]
MFIRIFICFAVSLAGLHAQLSNQTAAAVDKLVAKALAESGTPAVSIAIVKDGKVALAKAYGDARLEPKTPATAGMRFSIGSVSKQFMAGAILLAAEDGKLSLDDRVGKYLPDLTRANDITIRQVLSHTAGYQDYYPQDYVPPFMREPVTAEGILDRWAMKPLDFEPGTAWQYSNTGFVVAGRVLEKATGVPAFEFLRTRIFSRLGMQTVYDLDHQPLTTADASGYIRFAIGPLHPVAPEAPGWLFAAGELGMTAGDLALWDAALINGSVLSPRSFEEMITPVRLKNGAPTAYALGIGVADSNGHPRLSHGGAVSGFTSSNTIWPDLKLAVVVLSNKDGSTAPGRITGGLEALLLAPAQDPDAAKLLEQAKIIFAGLQEGRLDRALFTANGNSYFTAEAIGDYSASLKPLGTPKSFELTRSGLRGGFTERSYRMVFAEKTLSLVVRAAMDGHLEQYQISE